MIDNTTNMLYSFFILRRKEAERVAYELISESIQGGRGRVTFKFALPIDPSSAFYQRYGFLRRFYIDYRFEARTRTLMKEAEKLLQESCPDLDRICQLLDLICRVRLRSANRFRTAEQWWDFLAKVKDPLACGGEVSPLINEALSEHRGTIMEAMCGWNSRFPFSPDRDVIAVDGSKEALRRYSHPERRRYWVDFNSVRTLEDLSFCEPSSLDLISITLGYRFLKDPVRLLRVFKELLKPSGQMVFIENPCGGYVRLTQRSSEPTEVEDSLRRAGFREFGYERLTPEHQFYKMTAGQ